MVECTLHVLSPDCYLLQSKRIAKERRILNWEKLFSKLSSQKGHGRRWKFLIEPFKRKLKEGWVQAYGVSSNELDSEDIMPVKYALIVR